MRVEIEHCFDLGDLGLKNGRVLADIQGMRVTLVSAHLLSDPSSDILPFLRISAIERLKEQLRDASGARDAVFDWDYPDGAA